MFDISWGELLIVLVVALVVVGPKDLPKLTRKAGEWVGRARAMADQFRKSFDDMARQSELEELRAEVERLKMDRELSEFENEANAALKAEHSPAESAPYVNVEGPAQEEAPAQEAVHEPAVPDKPQ
jgi:sec-independent protein translocase protein TatB